MDKLTRPTLIVLAVCLICLREEEDQHLRRISRGGRPGGNKKRFRQKVLDGKRGAFLEAIPMLSEAEFRSKFNLSREEVDEVLDRPGVRAKLSSSRLKMSAREHMYALLVYLKEGCSLDALAWDCGINVSVLHRSLRRTSKVRSNGFNKPTYLSC